MHPGGRKYLTRAPARRIFRLGLVGFWLGMATTFATPAATTNNTPLPGQSYAAKGAADLPGTTSFYPYYHGLYVQAARTFSANTNSFTNAWNFASACFELGEFATNDTERAAVAQEGIAASRRAIALNAGHAAGHYYLGMNLGQLARTKNLGALKLVREMETSFHRSRKLDPKFNHAGADRCLGLMHREAPGWPISVGNKRLARQHLQEAVKLAPNFPENPLNWTESLVMWDERKAVGDSLKATESALAHARTNLTGVTWDASWRDWTNRWQSLTNQLVK